MTPLLVAALPSHHQADDRVRLQDLLTALDASPVALQRDLQRGEGRKGDHSIHGSLHLDHLPMPAEAVLIREAIGIKRKRHLTPEALATLKDRLAAGRTGSPSNDHSIDLIEQAATPTADLVHAQQRPAA
jgi:hypothetical protein